MKNQAAESLTFLGFSEIEALIYCFLLEESPATGYRISHAIGKPTANTYKAIAALARRGAVIVDDSEKSLCRAVPYSELLDQFRREFEERQNGARAALAKLRPSSSDDRVYQLASAEQVYERAKTMILSAKRAVLLDIFPKALAELSHELTSAGQRGIKVALKAYSPVTLKCVIVTQATDAKRVLSIWPGEQITIASDGDQFMTALLTKDGQDVHQAIWSNSTFLSCLMHNALHAELAMTELEARSEAGKSSFDALGLTRLKPPGFLKLNERYGA